MPLIFAKWILTAAAFLTPGTDQQFPGLSFERNDGVEVVTMSSTAWTPPVVCWGGFSPVPACTPSAGGFVPVFRRFFCVPAGVYSLVARVSLAPLDPDVPAFRGSLWWGSSAGGPDSGSLLVMDLEAKRDAWVNAGAAHVFIAAERTCYGLVYSAAGRATVNPDRRATYLAIHRIGD